MRGEQTNHQCKIIINNLDALPSKRWLIWHFFLGKKVLCIIHIWDFLWLPFISVTLEWIIFTSLCLISSHSPPFHLLSIFLYDATLSIGSFVPFNLISGMIFPFLRDVSNTLRFLLSNHSSVFLDQQYTTIHGLYWFPKTC